MENADAGYADGMGEYQMDEGFWESVSLLYGDIDLPEFDADYRLDYAGVDEAQPAIPSPS